MWPHLFVFVPFAAGVKFSKTPLRPEPGPAFPPVFLVPVCVQACSHFEFRLVRGVAQHPRPPPRVCLSVRPAPFGEEPPSLAGCAWRLCRAPGARACGGLFRGARRPWLCFSAASSGRGVRCCRRLALSASGAAHGGLTTLVLLCGSYAARQMFPRECPLPVVKSPPLVTLFVGLGGSECGFPRTSSARVCSPSELRRVSRRQPPAGRRLLARAEPSVPPGGRGRPRALGEVAGPRGLSPATAPSAFRARCVPRVSCPLCFACCFGVQALCGVVLRFLSCSGPALGVCFVVAPRFALRVSQTAQPFSAGASPTPCARH